MYANYDHNTLGRTKMIILDCRMKMCFFLRFYVASDGLFWQDRPYFIEVQSRIFWPNTRSKRKGQFPSHWIMIFVTFISRDQDNISQVFFFQLSKPLPLNNFTLTNPSLIELAIMDILCISGISKRSPSSTPMQYHNIAGNANNSFNQSILIDGLVRNP